MKKNGLCRSCSWKARGRIFLRIWLPMGTRGRWPTWNTLCKPTTRATSRKSWSGSRRWARPRLPAAKSCTKITMKWPRPPPNTSATPITESLSSRCEQCGQKRGAFRHGADKRMFGGTVRAVAHGAKTVESRHAGGGRQVAIRAAARRGFTNREAHFVCEELRLAVERGAHLAFERRAIEPAGDPQARAGKNRPQRAQPAFEPFHIGGPRSANVNHGAGAVGDDVAASASLDDVRIYRNPAAEIVEAGDPRDLQRQFVHGVYALLRLETRVGGAAGDFDFHLAHAFARGFQRAAQAKGRLENKDRVAAQGFALDDFARSAASDLFVGSPQAHHALAERRPGALQSLRSKQRLNDAGLHVECARPPGAAFGDAERHAPKGAQVIDRVEVPENQQLPLGSSAGGPQGHAKMIAAVLLPKKLDARAALVPLRGDALAAAVHRSLDETRRFQPHQRAESLHHFFLLLSQGGKEHLRVGKRQHNRRIVTMGRTTGNVVSTLCTLRI